MIDSDDVFLLQIDEIGDAFPAITEPAPNAPATSTVFIRTWFARSTADSTTLAAAAAEVTAEVRGRTDFVASLSSANTVNNFPALPVREDVRAYVWISRTDEPNPRSDGSDLPAFQRLADHPATELQPETLRLRPTPRSRLR
jgi:hypothetical protein